MSDALQVILFFWGGGRVSYSSGWFLTCYVAKDGLELLLLPLILSARITGLNHFTQFMRC